MSVWRIAAMTDTLSLVHARLGEPGSGRVRYGAAMALYRDGQITAEVLEAYRIASAYDALDPATLLAERGLPPLPSLPRPVLLTPLARLYQLSRHYILGLDHPGAKEVAASLPEDPGPERPVPHQANAVVERWLSVALAALGQTHDALAEAIALAAGSLTWVTYDGYPRSEIGEGFATGHAYASIRGGDAPFSATDNDLGLFLIAPGTLYRDHHHAAPELYAPLTGPHGWRFGPEKPVLVKPAHVPVWNPPHQPHLTRVGKVPFLCLFVWTRDVDEVAMVIPANDWPELEALEIG